MDLKFFNWQHFEFKMEDEAGQWTRLRFLYRLYTYCGSIKSIYKYGFYFKMADEVDEQDWGSGIGCMHTEFQSN